MPIRHDFRCEACGRVEEIIFSSYENYKTSTVTCTCGGAASQVWLTAPGLAGVWEPGTRGIAPSFRPGYDIQTGRHFNDRSERDRYLKERGLIGLGVDEFRRTTAAASSDPEPDYSGLEEVMKEAYAENEAGKITPHLIVDSKTLGPIVEGE